MRIAIVKLSSLGDIIHAMVVLQFIKNFNKEISIDWIVDEDFKELLEFHPDINQVHSVKLRKAKKKKSFFLLLNELKKVKKIGSYDIVIDMQGLLKSALIAKLIPSRKTIGFDQNSIKERFASLFYRDKFNYSYAANVIERNISIIEFSLGFFIRKEQVQLKNPFIFSSESEIDLKLSNKKKNILLIPGASNISKCYPVSKFAELTKLIDANFVVIWGNKHERELAKRIVELSPLVNLSEKLSIGSLAFLISKMDLVIGPDTGPTHISWALNVPSITLFGSTPGFRNTYETSINRIIESESTVDPEKINKNDFSIKNISIHKIAEISSSLIK